VQQSTEPGLAPALTERVLERLGFSERPPATLEGLRALYAAWGQHVPFDNLRKLIHLRRGDAGLLPGSLAQDFFDAWLRDGTGATCWGGNGALHALLRSLGFEALRGYATMMIAPDLPPNHATVVVDFDSRRYLVDASILSGEPLELAPARASSVDHPARGARVALADGKPLIRWRPIHLPQGLDCRIDHIGCDAATFLDFHERSRPWSPFNYQLYARVNRGERVVGTGFGQHYVFEADGSVQQAPLRAEDRLRYLVEVLGIREALAAQVPADLPTPPPPPRPG
jgi:hypothetical protein